MVIRQRDYKKVLKEIMSESREISTASDEVEYDLDKVITSDDVQDPRYRSNDQGAVDRLTDVIMNNYTNSDQDGNKFATHPSSLIQVK